MLTSSQSRNRVRFGIAMLAAIILAAAAVHAGDAERSPDQVYLSSAGMKLTAADWATHLEIYPEVGQLNSDQQIQAADFIRSTMVQILVRRLIDRLLHEQDLVDDGKTDVKIQAIHRGNVANWVQAAMLPREMEPTREEIIRAYDDRISEFTHPDRLEVRQIYLETKDVDADKSEKKRLLAEELSRVLQKDPSRFRELALQYSESQVQPRDRLLELEHKGMMMELRDPVWAISEGQTSGVITSPHGFHIIRVEKRHSGRYPLEKAEKKIRRDLMRPRLEKYVGELVDHAGEKFGLVLHETPDRLEPDSRIVSGAADFNGAELAFASGIRLEDAPSGKELEEWIATIQRGFVLMELARSRGWIQDPQFWRMQMDAENQVYEELYYRHFLDSRGGVTRFDIREYYEAHRSEYLVPIRYTIREMRLLPERVARAGEVVPGMAVMEKALDYRRAWEAGSDFEQLIRAEPMARNSAQGGMVTIIEPSLNADGTINHGILKGLGKGEMSQPIRVIGGYALIHVLEIERDVQKPLDEKLEKDIRSRISGDIRTEMRRSLTNQVRNGAVWSLPENLAAEHIKQTTSPSNLSPLPTLK